MANKTILTVAQKKACLETGAKMSDIRAMQDEGMEYEDILSLCQTEADARNLEKQGDADRTAKATKRAMRPENENAPRISVFHPKGWDARVIPACETYWNGQDVRGDVDTDEEITLINQTQAGVYTCTKADGSITKVTVEVETDVRGVVTKRKISFPCSGKNREGHASRVSYLKEMLAQTPSPVLKPTELVTLGA